MMTMLFFFLNRNLWVWKKKLTMWTHARDAKWENYWHPTQWFKSEQLLSEWDTEILITRKSWTLKSKPENVFVQGKGTSERFTEKRTTVIRKACFFTINSLCQTFETPSKLTRVPLPWCSGQFGRGTSRVTCLKQSTLISYPGIAQRTCRTWRAAFQKCLWNSLFNPAWFTVDCPFWFFSGVHNDIPQETRQPLDLSSGWH